MSKCYDIPPKVKVLIIVSGGVVQDVVTDNSVVDWEVIDYDNAESNGRDWFAELSAEAQAYVLADDPDFQLKYEDAETTE